MTTKTPKKRQARSDVEYMELARRVFAAVISHDMGISLQYAYTRYAKDRTLGPSWVAAGRALQKMKLGIVEKALSPES